MIKKRIKLLEEQLASKSDEMKHLRKQLVSKERLFEKSEKINQDLREQILFLSAKLQVVISEHGTRPGICGNWACKGRVFVGIVGVSTGAKFNFVFHPV